MRKILNMQCLLADMKVLERETDARGRKFNVHKLHIPDVPVCITDNDLKGLVFEAGEDMREAGERALRPVMLTSI